MKTIQFNTHYRKIPTVKEKTLNPSQTVQGETLTIRQLFERAAIQGHFPIQETMATYMDVEDVTEITSMYKQGLDLTDLQSHAEHLAAAQQTIQLKLDKQIKLQKEADKEAINKAKEIVAKESAAKLQQEIKQPEN